MIGLGYTTSIESAEPPARISSAKSERKRVGVAVFGPLGGAKVFAISSSDMKAPEQMGPRFRAFTLIELLLVIAVIGIVAALLLPVLARSKAAGQSALCKNHLHQIGLAMEMYISDHNVYPRGMGGPPFQTWADRLDSYNPVPWTNAAWQCPTYIAEGGNVAWQPPPPGGGNFEASSSYAYNALGMQVRIVKVWPPLGLGNLKLSLPENRVVAPSEMYAVGDARPFQYHNLIGFDGRMLMWPWKLGPGLHEARAPHAGCYNLLFVDGHVNLIKRRDYLYPPRSAENWNRDHQPHPESWAPTNQWVIQN